MEAVKVCLSYFDRQQKIRLLPFVITMTLYLVQPYSHKTLIGLIFKILPMLSLIGYVLMTKSEFPTHTRRVSMETIIPRDPYSSYIFVGLVTSMIADVLVTMNYVIGVIGVVLFMFAHVFYVIGIDASGRHKGWSSSMTSLFVLLFIDIYLIVLPCLDGLFDQIFIFTYFFPLFLAAWKASAAFKENPGNKACMFACIGSLSFAFSDILIVLYGTQCLPIPLGVHIYMLAYYVAQFGWAVSTHDTRSS